MKRSLHSIVSFLLAFLVLSSTCGLQLDMHFCQDKLQRVNAFGKAKTCTEVAQISTTCCGKNRLCHSQIKDVATEEHDDCCHNSTLSLDLNIDALSQHLVLELENQPETFCLINTSSLYKQTFLISKVHYPIIYPPPERWQGVSKSILFGSFLC